MLDKTITQLLEIVKCVLNNEIYQEEIIDDSKLFTIARENGLSGMIFTALDKTKLSPDIYNKFQQEFYHYTIRDTRQMQAINEVNKLFNEHHIEHIFLKGSFLKSVYPQSYMRSMGDIDILIKDKDLEKVHEILAANNYNNFSNSYNHDSFCKGKDIVLEIHPKLDSEISTKYDYLFTDVWGMAEKINEHQYQFKPEYNLVYFLYHTVKHFRSSGVGLRTILDIGLFINKYSSSFNINLINKFLKKTDLNTFFINMLWLNNMYFDLNDLIHLIKEYQLDINFYENITNYIIQSGVHGHGKDFNSFLCGLTSNSLEKSNITKGKRAYIFKLIFPSYKAMQSMYPYLKKYKFLLPYTWFVRILKLTFKKTRSSISKLKRLKVSNEVIEHNVEIYRKLGL